MPKNQAIATNYAELAADLVRAHNGEITVKKALMDHGIAEKQANKGWKLVEQRKALNTAFRVALNDDYARYAAAGDIPADILPKLITGRLAQNIREGTDKSVQSCKTLGSRRDLNMWTADSIAGVVIIECPKNGLPPLPVDCGVELSQASVVNGSIDNKMLQRRELPAISE